MTRLKVLNLSSNRLTSVPRDTFHNLTSLETLFLNDNMIAALPLELLFALSNLKNFYAEFNKIERIQPGFFRHNLNLENIFLQNNDIKSITEDFTRLNSLEVVDLRENADYCRLCEVLEAAESQKRANECTIDKFEGEKKSKLEFEDCARKKVEEKDDKWAMLEVCFTTKAKFLENVEKNFTNCGSQHKDMKLESIGEIDKCIVRKLHEEKNAQEAFTRCVSSKTDPEINDLLQSCYKNKNADVEKVTNNFNSCMFCDKMKEQDNRDRCNVRYMKIYGHSIADFKAIVEKFFVK